MIEIVFVTLKYILFAEDELHEVKERRSIQGSLIGFDQVKPFLENNR